MKTNINWTWVGFMALSIVLIMVGLNLILPDSYSYELLSWDGLKILGGLMLIMWAGDASSAASNSSRERRMLND